MFKLEDFKTDTLLYIHYNFSDETIESIVSISKVYKTEMKREPFNDIIWVNDIWSFDGDLGEKEFLYLDDFNTGENKHLYIFIDKCYYPELTKLIDESPEPTNITNFIKSIHPEHFV